MKPAYGRCRLPGEPPPNSWKRRAANRVAAGVWAPAAVLTVAYFTYGRLLCRLLGLDASRKTPAVEMRDDVDYVPIEQAYGRIATTLFVVYPPGIASIVPGIGDTATGAISAYIVWQATRFGVPKSVLLRMAGLGPRPKTREQVIQCSVRMLRRVGSPGFHTPTEYRTRLAGRAYDRAFRPEGHARQTHAILATGSFEHLLPALHAVQHAEN